MPELAKAYDPQEHEARINQAWNDSGIFNPDNLELPEDAPAYTIVLPPPNVTDKLHLGHASMLAIEDLLVRFHRMSGYRTLWIPGTDHAAIATQTVVERRLYKEEAKTRHELGREEFLKRVQAFALETQATIIGQIKNFGASLDWSRLAFTLDEPRQQAVRRMFVDMYEAGVLYRGERIVNWCPRCQSTLADDEVEHKEEKTVLYTFKYSADFPFAISTTRPETKLGDSAVAVHPKDERYAKYIGQTIAVDFCGQTLDIQVIGDREVEPDFGTGALGVTPAHSMTDWRMAEENGLKIIKVIDESGKIRDGFGAYSGKTVNEARETVVVALRERGLIEKEEEIEHNVGTCYRCSTPIEPLPSLQWFIGVDRPLERLGGKSLKEAALAVAESGEVNFVPERFHKRYVDWMSNLRDWCVSRQIWFGHRIPVWYDEAGEAHVPKKVSILLARHGETEANLKRVHDDGPNSSSLTEAGREQARMLGESLRGRNIGTIMCSDLPRSKETAEIVAGVMGFDTAAIRVVPELHEIEAGGLNGESYEGQRSGTRQIIESGKGETLESLERRAQHMHRLFEELPGDSEALVVGHNAFNSCLRAELAGKSKEQYIENREQIGPIANTSFVELTLLVDPSGEGLHQDTDTLDTWFSAGMWTFSTLGWPNAFAGGVKAGDLAKFHPTDVLETGYEIITLWVSRMIMMSIFALGEIPFKNVYLHGMVLDKEGKKMSKTKGNGIDPIVVGQEYGTDAVRLALLLGNTPGVDVRLSEEKIASFRNFVNKLWNVSRFIMSREAADTDGEMTVADRWIASRLAKLIPDLTEKIRAFDFSGAGEALRAFTLDDLADWYVEASKFDRSRASDALARRVLETVLKLWHPFMPFVTEVIWKELCPEAPMLAVAQWPEAEAGDSNDEAERDFELLRSVIGAIRNLRSEHRLEPSRKVKVTLIAGAFATVLEAGRTLVMSLRTGIENLDISEAGSTPAGALYATVQGIDIYLEAPLDSGAERARLEKEIAYVTSGLRAVEAKLANVEYKEKAPAALVAAEEKKASDYREALEKMQTQLAALAS